MFPGQVSKAFEYFCRWAYHSSRRAPGKKIFYVDELWKWTTPNHIPQDLAVLSQEGRVENLEMVVATQVPQKMNGSIIGSSTELVCFRLGEECALDKVEELGADREAVQALPLGSFIAWNRLSGSRLDGKLF